MTPNLNHISSELLRISSYAGVMANLAKTGNQSNIDSLKLQAIFEDIAHVTEHAYAEVEHIINNDCPFNQPYVDKYDKPPMPPRSAK